MARSLPVLLIFMSLTGCGVVETSGAVAVEASAKAQEAQEGLKTEARVQQQLDAATRQSADQMKAADAEAK
jgi:hypothetical protein